MTRTIEKSPLSNEKIETRGLGELVFNKEKSNKKALNLDNLFVELLSFLRSLKDGEGFYPEVEEWLAQIESCHENIREDLSSLQDSQTDLESRHESALDLPGQFQVLEQIKNESLFDNNDFPEEYRQTIVSLIDKIGETVDSMKNLPMLLMKDEPVEAMAKMQRVWQEQVGSNEKYKKLIENIDKKVSVWIKQRIDRLEGKLGDNIKKLLLRYDLSRIAGKTAKYATLVGIASLSFDCAGAIHTLEHPSGGIADIDLDGNSLSNEPGELMNLGNYRLGGVSHEHGHVQGIDLYNEQGHHIKFLPLIELRHLSSLGEERSREMTMIANSMDEKVRGVNYEIRDKEAFDQFILQEARQVIDKKNELVSDVDLKMDLSRLKGNELLLVATEIITRNMEYDKLATEKTDEGVAENKIISETSLDDILMVLKKGVCRHYSAELEYIAGRLRELSDSSYLKNIEVKDFCNNQMMHAYNVIIEQQGDSVNIYFVDITEATDKKEDDNNWSFADAISEDYSTMDRLLNNFNGGKIFNQDELRVIYKDLIFFNQDNETELVKWNGRLAESYYIFREYGEARQYYEETISHFQNIMEKNKEKRKNFDHDTELVPDMSFVVSQYLTTLYNTKDWAGLEKFILNKKLILDLNVSKVYNDNILLNYPGTSNQSSALSYLGGYLLGQREYQKLIDLAKKTTTMGDHSNIVMDSYNKINDFKGAFDYTLRTIDEASSYGGKDFERYFRYCSNMLANLKDYKNQRELVSDAEIINLTDRFLNLSETLINYHVPNSSVRIRYLVKDLLDFIADISGDKSELWIKINQTINDSIAQWEKEFSLKINI